MSNDDFDQLSRLVGIPVLIIAVLALFAVQSLRLLNRQVPWQMTALATTTGSASLVIVVLRFVVLVR